MTYLSFAKGEYMIVTTINLEKEYNEVLTWLQ